MVFETDSLNGFGETYPNQPARLRHRLKDHALLSLDSLAELAVRLPPASIEYNAADLPVSCDPDEAQSNGLSPQETIRKIQECHSWLAIKNIEQDEAYAALLENCLNALAPLVRSLSGPMHKKEGFIFISSPGAVTPFHMDPEHNILLQISGAKTMRLYPGAGVVSAEQHEAFHGAGGHRNLAHKKAYDRYARAFDLQPGDALYVPVKAPHWVQNGGAPSISLSIAWRSRLSENDAALHRANAWLRRKGAVPPPPASASIRDRAKILASRAVSRLSAR